MILLPPCLLPFQSRIYTLRETDTLFFYLSFRGKRVWARRCTVSSRRQSLSRPRLSFKTRAIQFSRRLESRSLPPRLVRLPSQNAPPVRFRTETTRTRTPSTPKSESRRGAIGCCAGRLGTTETARCGGWRTNPARRSPRATTPRCTRCARLTCTEGVNQKSYR